MLIMVPILAARYARSCEHLRDGRPNRCLPFRIVLIDFG